MRIKLPIIFLIDSLVAFICVFGIYHISQKAGLPATIIIQNNVPFISETNQFFLKGDKIIRVNGIEVSNLEDIELVCDRFNVDDLITVDIQRNGVILQIVATLITFYSTQYLLILSLVALVFFSLAVFVLVRRRDYGAAHILHWAFIFVTIIATTTWGKYTIEPLGSGYFIRFVFSAAYAFMPVMFIHFGLTYPRKKYYMRKTILTVFYFAASLLTLWQIIIFSFMIDEPEIGTINAYITSFDAVRLFFSFCIVAGIVNFIHSYRTAYEESERRQLRWLFLGLALGPAGFITLWQIPQTLTSQGLVPEEYVLLVILITPVMFAISIVKYHIMDIDLIFKRATVYAFVLGIILTIYASIVGLIAALVGTFTIELSVIISAFAAVVVAILFQPVRVYIQRIVDKWFFRIRYNFQVTEREIVETLKQKYTTQEAAHYVLTSLEAIFLPLKLGIFLKDEFENKYKLAVENNLKGDKVDTIINIFTALPKNSHNIFAADYIVEPGIGYKPLESNFLTQTGIPIVLPMYSEKNEVLGFIVIGPKKSGIRYSIEDIELLLTVTLNLGLTIERNELHKSLVVEQMEAERLAEINKLKSYFVSSVSHDLKTPLTSIRMFAEILRNSKECKRRDTREALEIIEGESERLARLIENVLDFSKVERGIKDYQFKKTELNVIIRKVIRSMKYQFKMGEFIVKTQLLKKRLSLVADSDAIAEALINLLSNAMKYCGRKRKIEISTTLMRNFAVLSVRDFGIGIPNDKLEKIFEPFYRHKDERQLQSGGAGLGLSLVKHIVESHKGRIEVISKVNSGSTFKLYFPLR